MIKSIKYFLVISLLVSITLASAINGVGNYLLDEKVIQPYLDNQLIRASSLIEVFYESNIINAKNKAALVESLRNSLPNDKQKFVFQIWKGDEVYNKAAANVHLSLRSAPIGFSDRVANNEDWRIYVTYNANLQVKIAVAETYNLRRVLADDIARNNAYILLITYPVFGFLVWIIVTLALKSITKVTTEIKSRALTYLEPVQLTQIPDEIKPLIAELNRLFIRLKFAFEKNKRFAGDAAHELRTPLAALKTHVQVALNAVNDVERCKALKKVIEGVDRSAHVVDQLLTLSRLGEEENLTDIKPIDLYKLAVEIIAYIAPLALEKNVEIELTNPPNNSMIIGSDTALGILIRNIVDNAIRYTPTKGEVKVQILNDSQHVILRVTDTGSGIPLELRDRVFERFYRILGTKASGSGLGLAIVTQIAALHHATIQLSTPKNGIGLQFDVAFPAYQA